MSLLYIQYFFIPLRIKYTKNYFNAYIDKKIIMTLYIYFFIKDKNSLDIFNLKCISPFNN